MPPKKAPEPPPVEEKTAGQTDILVSALYGTGKLADGTGKLQGSQSMPTLQSSVNMTGFVGIIPPARERLPGVSMTALLLFLFPKRLENPDSCGRFEIFGKFGPTDEEGNLRGGTAGAHVHGDVEVNQMIRHNCKEALYDLFLPKDRSTVESIVSTLMPVAMSHRYTEADIRHMLRKVPRYPGTDRMMFTEMQECIKATQLKRLGEMATRAQSGKPIAPPKERPQKVPFQSLPCHHLMAITRKKKHLPQEEVISKSKKLHAYSSLCASLEDQVLTEQVMMNSIMCRDLGRLDDKWDRYCALRRTGRSSYVQTRNEYRFNPAMDCGLGNKHPGISSLLVASCAGSSAGALLGAS